MTAFTGKTVLQARPRSSAFRQVLGYVPGIQVRVTILSDALPAIVISEGPHPPDYAPPLRLKRNIKKRVVQRRWVLPWLTE